MSGRLNSISRSYNEEFMKRNIKAYSGIQRKTIISIFPRVFYPCGKMIYVVTFVRNTPLPLIAYSNFPSVIYSLLILVYSRHILEPSRRTGKAFLNIGSIDELLNLSLYGELYVFSLSKETQLNVLQS